MSKALPIRLRPDPSAHAGSAPLGFVAARAGAAELVMKLALRHDHHPNLKLALTADKLIVLSAPGEPSPWAEHVEHFLTRTDALYLPVGMALDVPERWRSAVIDRLARQHGVGQPLLLLPKGDGRNGHYVEATPLADAMPLAMLDPSAVAAMCKP